MKLLTKEIERKLPKLGATEGVDLFEKKIVCKFFNPMGQGTWYVVEGEEDDGDWRFFGLVDLFVREWGYFTLNELESVDVGFGLGIERDIHWRPKPMKEVPA
jgi:hypothetical protein